MNNQEFLAELFDDVDPAERAGKNRAVILMAHSLRTTDIAVEV